MMIRFAWGRLYRPPFIFWLRNARIMETNRRIAEL
jgi:hypothetical protein